MKSSNTFLIIYNLVLMMMAIVKLCSGATTIVRCVGAERESLLRFRNSLTDPSERLSSWVGQECCEWKGVRCDNRTGNVAELNLRNPFKFDGDDEFGDRTRAYTSSCLGGKLNPSLLALKSLAFLDLSLNNFNGNRIPDFIGELRNLRHLNLSFSSFSGKVPNSLGKLKKLEVLDLFSDSYLGVASAELRAVNLDWLSGLSSLRHLNLGHVKLDKVGEKWLQKISSLRSLSELNLHWCELKGLPVSLHVVNFTSLRVLDLSENSFGSQIPLWLFNLTDLRTLRLSWNFFKGPIPSEVTNLKLLEELDLSSNLYLEGPIPGFLGRLPVLKRLDLSGNEFTGEIRDFLNGFPKSSNVRLESLILFSNSLVGSLPESLGRLRNLQRLSLSGNSFSGSLPLSIVSLALLNFLDLSSNKMNGTVPKSFGQLSELVDSNLAMNSWTGFVTEDHLMNLKALKTLRITTDQTKPLVMNVSREWLPPFRLTEIHLENCKVGPAFPSWLGVQTELTFVTLKNAGISDVVPQNWIRAMAPRVSQLDLSKNQMKGKLPSKLAFPKLRNIDLSSNSFEGTLPLWTTNATDLFLEDNSFSGPVPEDLAGAMPRLEKLFLSRNRLTGKIPSSLCNLQSLQILSLRRNVLVGPMPDCWSQFMLWGLDFSHNNLSGVIPSSLSSLRSLSVLLLSDNNLQGEIPSALQNCSGLTTVDLSRNKLTGAIPSWFQGKVMSSLYRMRLDSNEFSGYIPSEICDLPNLHVLDLSENRLSGTIPKCFGNFPVFVSFKPSTTFQGLVYSVLRGKEPEYSKVVAEAESINLSGNNLTGVIPDQITKLSALFRLNLSRNRIGGRIPNDIGNLQVETLDLSRNALSGQIPDSISNMLLLKHLNLSYNNLEGKIPSLPQFKDASVFEGNPLLCGPPLPTQCKENLPKME